MPYDLSYRRVPRKRDVKMEVQNQEILGDRLFAIQKYKQAIERFDKSIERNENARNLQYRPHLKKAHAYFKLRNYDDAIQAAAQSIRLARDNADGYLLAANALLNQKKMGRAVAILEAGLTKVKADGRKWNKINKQLDEVKTKVTLYAKRRDFLDPTEVSNFPMELVFNIFGYLGQRDLLRCEQVSKRWKTVLRSNPQFYQSLEIDRRIPAVSVNRWMNLTENSPYKLKHLAFKLAFYPGYQESNKDFLFNVAGMTKQLKSVRLQIEDRSSSKIHDLYPRGSNFLTKLVIDGVGKLCMTHIEVMIKNLPGLEHAEFHNVTKSVDGIILHWPPSLPNLKKIYIIGARGEHKEMPETLLNLNNLIKSAPNVTDARLRDFGVSSAWTKARDFAAWEKLETLDISKLRIAKLPTFPRSLRHLTLTDIATVAHYELDGAKKGTIDISSYSLPHLITLDVQGSDFTHFTYELSHAGLQNGSLETLKMGDTTHIVAQEDPYMHWPQRMPGPSTSLSHLSLKDLNQIPEDVIMKFLAQYQWLIKVDLSNCNITGSTIKQLFKQENDGPGFIHVEGCTKIGRDAIEAARDAGAWVYSDFMPRQSEYNGVKHP